MYAEVRIGGTSPTRGGERVIKFHDIPSQCRTVAADMPGKPTAHPSFGLVKKTDFRIAVV
jgi:hypothetical protein